MNTLNEWNQLFTNNVRKTGSNNAKRFLMYPSYASSPEAILPDGSYGDPAWSAGKVGAMFKLPSDSAGSGKQIVTFHYYDPQPFAHNGEVYEWGKSGEKTTVDNLFARFKRQFVDKNIPVVIGETGPVRCSGTYRDRDGNFVVIPGSERKMTSSEIATAKANRIVWAEYVFSKAKANGLVPVCWDNGVYSSTNSGDQFGFINRSTGQPNSDESREVINAMMKAVGNK
jgi:hypothetical protein